MLGMELQTGAYYRDIHAWISAILLDDTRFKPASPNCQNCNKVLNNGWPEWPGRRVFALDTCYYIMTRRYKCMHCKDAADGMQKNDPDRPSWSFMGWHEDSLTHSAFGIGETFPAHLTRKAAVDKKLLGLIRASMNNGIRAETFSNILGEMYSLKYFHDYIDREFETASADADYREAFRGDYFGSFGDRMKYNGSIPTGKYLNSVFVNYSMSLQDYFDTEIKRWPALGLCLDVSYYVTKILWRVSSELQIS
jgi:hypothetical protein